MKFKLIVSFVIFLLLFLIGCSPQPIVAQTLTPTLKPIVTNSPKPTATTNSAVTPSPTFSPAEETKAAVDPKVAKAMQTQENFMFVAVPATLEARNVKCKDGFVLEQGLDVVRTSNDKWTLFTCSPIPQNINDRWTPGVVDYGKRYTQIIKTDLSKTWTIQHNTFDYSTINRPDALMTPYRWTADGKYLYLYPRSYPGGSGGTDSMSLETYINTLYRINLETGEFELVLRNDQYDALALSPDDQFLVYSENKKPDVIHVRNMENGNDLQVKLNEDIIVSGGFVWNSESTKVVVIIGYGKQAENSYDDLSGTAIFVLTPKNMHIQKVLAKDSRIFTPYKCSDNIYWLDKNTICLYSINQELDSWNKIFTFNIKTGTILYLRPFP